MAPVVRKEVLNALADAEAQGQKCVRVIVGLRGPDSLEPVQKALNRMGAMSTGRSSGSFIAVRLSREQVGQVGRLKEHVKAVWLDRPVSAAKR